LETHHIIEQLQKRWGIKKIPSDIQNEELKNQKNRKKPQLPKLILLSCLGYFTPKLCISFPRLGLAHLELSLPKFDLLWLLLVIQILSMFPETILLFCTHSWDFRLAPYNAHTLFKNGKRPNQCPYIDTQRDSSKPHPYKAQS